MSKHTPGPWFQSHRKSVYGWYQTEVYTADGEVVATVAWYPRTLNDKSTTTDREANARLIAAAPELLEACQTIAEWLRREDEGFPDAAERRKTSEGEAEWHEWWVETLRLCSLAQTQALAAITKATEG